MPTKGCGSANLAACFIILLASAQGAAASEGDAKGAADGPSTLECLLAQTSFANNVTVAVAAALSQRNGTNPVSFDLLSTMLASVVGTCTGLVASPVRPVNALMPQEAGDFLAMFVPKIEALSGIPMRITLKSYYAVPREIIFQLENGLSTSDTWVYDSTGLVDIAEATPDGGFLDLTEFISEDDSLLNWADIHPFFRSVSSVYKGKVIGVPVITYQPYLFYRLDIFAKYNLTVPTTWDEFVSLAERMNGTDFNGDSMGDNSLCFHDNPNMLNAYYATMILASHVQTTGFSQGVLWDPATMEPLVGTPAMRSTLRLLQRMSAVNARGRPDSELTDFPRCLMMVYHAETYKNSIRWPRLMGSIGVAMVPGSSQVLDRTTMQLVNCTPDVCRDEGGKVNRAPCFGPATVSVAINPFVSSSYQRAAWHVATAAYGTQFHNQYFLFNPLSPIGPIRLSTMDTSPAGLKMWTSKGYNLQDTRRFLTMTKATLDHPNHVGDIGIKNMDSYRDILDNAVTRIFNTSSGDASADKDLVESVLQTIDKRFRAQMASEPDPKHVAEGYRAQLKFTFPPPSPPPPSPMPPPPGTPAPPSGAVAVETQGGQVQLAWIVAPVMAALLLLVALLGAVQYSRQAKRRHRALLGGAVVAPMIGPDTTLLLTDIEGSTRLFEAVPEAMDQALVIHNALMHRVVHKHTGYASASEGDGFIIAFHSAVDALGAAAELQELLLAAEWPAELLTQTLCAPVWMSAKPTGPMASAWPQSVVEVVQNKKEWKGMHSLAALTGTVSAHGDAATPKGGSSWVPGLSLPTSISQWRMGRVGTNTSLGWNDRPTGQSATLKTLRKTASVAVPVQEPPDGEQLNWINGDVNASGSYMPRPSASGAYVPRPSASGSYMPRPSASGAYMPRPSASGAYMPRPSASGAHMPLPSVSGSYMPRPIASGADMPRPSVSGSYMPRPSASGAATAQNHGQSSATPPAPLHQPSNSLPTQAEQFITSAPLTGLSGSTSGTTHVASGLISSPWHPGPVSVALATGTAASTSGAWHPGATAADNSCTLPAHIFLSVPPMASEASNTVTAMNPGQLQIGERAALDEPQVQLGLTWGTFWAAAVAWSSASAREPNAYFTEQDLGTMQNPAVILGSHPVATREVSAATIDLRPSLCGSAPSGTHQEVHVHPHDPAGDGRPLAQRKSGGSRAVVVQAYELGPASVGGASSIRWPMEASNVHVTVDEQVRSSARERAGSALVHQGLRVRMGAHSGLSDASEVTWNAATGRHQYGGQFLSVASAVCNAANGGMILVSQSTFKAVCSSEALSEMMTLLAAGEHYLQNFTAGATQSHSLYEVIPHSVALRSLVLEGIRSQAVVSRGYQATPCGQVAVAYFQAVGLPSLMSWDADITRDSLGLMADMATALLGPFNGYLLDCSEALGVLAAFSSAADAIKWALVTQQALLQANWPEQLLAHRLGEQVGFTGSIMDTNLFNTHNSLPPMLSEPHASEPLSHQPTPPGSLLRTRPSWQDVLDEENPPPDLRGTPRPTFGSASFRGSAGRLSNSAKTAAYGSTAGSFRGFDGRLSISLNAPATANTQASYTQAAEVVVQKRPGTILRGLRTKCGIDVGPVRTSVNNISGRMTCIGKVMNRAARVAGLVQSSQVWCSAEAWDASLPPGCHPSTTAAALAAAQDASSMQTDAPTASDPTSMLNDPSITRSRNAFTSFLSSSGTSDFHGPLGLRIASRISGSKLLQPSQGQLPEPKEERKGTLLHSGGQSDQIDYPSADDEKSASKPSKEQQSDPGAASSRGAASSTGITRLGAAPRSATATAVATDPSGTTRLAPTIMAPPTTATAAAIAQTASPTGPSIVVATTALSASAPATDTKAAARAADVRAALVMAGQLASCGVTASSLGRHRLKGIAAPAHLIKVELDQQQG